MKTIFIYKVNTFLGKPMNNRSSKSFKLTTVIFAVIVMALGAVLSGNSVAVSADEATSLSEE
jgi:hypothetical protein